MASSIDSSEGAHTLPRPELNPLLNPLLAENMGRWAEVYFTSAPEKREEAVVELLRELEARNAEVAPTSQAAPVAQRVIAAGSGADRMAKSTLEDQQRCDACGHDNPPRHQFCGMCGSQLGGTAPKQFRLNEISDRDEAEDELMETSGYERSEAEFREPIEEEPPIPVSRSRRDPYDLSLFQSLRKNEFTAELDYDSSPSVRYRYYIGAVLAILILVLGYMAWSAGRASQSAQGTPPPPPPAATESTPTPANPSAEPAATNPPKTNESKAAVPAANTATDSTAKPAEAPKSAGAAPAPSTAHIPTSTSTSGSLPIPPPPTNVGSQTFAGNGAEEYAIAQRYLGSRPRDSAEAAKWLWKAMAKHNGPSMVALADLYLKGDGVSKNCDQARVLLDSAAQRGMAGAGERLRNLQAFGCQ